MHILLINPNSTASMTSQVLESAVRVAYPTTRVTAVNPVDTPVSIEGGADEAMAVPAMLSEIRKGQAQGVDAYVIACFDDPGLHALRSAMESHTRSTICCVEAPACSVMYLSPDCDRQSRSNGKCQLVLSA